MTEGFFDQVARTLAEPMPRRRAVRVIGASLAAIAVPGISPRSALAWTTRGSAASLVCAGKQICKRYKDPNDWTKGQEERCCPFPAQQWRCGPDGWTCLDTCAATGKALGKKTTPTWSKETLGGSDPDLRDRPKRYDCCVRPDTIPSNGECLPNCGLPQYGGPYAKACGKTCCPTYQLCVDGKCRPCEDFGGHTCQPPKGPATCCKKGTSCCFNATTTACCGAKQTCRAQNRKSATCVCEQGKKCGTDCCESGETCCGGKECCAMGETCAANGCCPKGRALCGSQDPRHKPVCCDEGEYCFWKAEDGIVPLVGTCKRGCAPGNRAGTQCCGTGYKPNRARTRCVPA